MLYEAERTVRHSYEAAKKQLETLRAVSLARVYSLVRIQIDPKSAIQSDPLLPLPPGPNPLFSVLCMETEAEPSQNRFSADISRVCAVQERMPSQRKWIRFIQLYCVHDIFMKWGDGCACECELWVIILYPQFNYFGNYFENGLFYSRTLALVGIFRFIVRAHGSRNTQPMREPERRETNIEMMTERRKAYCWGWLNAIVVEWLFVPAAVTVDCILPRKSFTHTKIGWPRAGSQN